MFDFITAPENIPFAVALLVLLIIAGLEGVGALFGVGLSNMLDSLLPNTDLSLDVEGPDLEASNTLGHLLSWLRVGQVPVLVLLIVFLASFGLAGFILQKSLWTIFGFMLPVGIAWIPAFCVALPAVRIFGTILHKMIPKDETNAVSQKTFIGRLATITLGTAQTGHAAQGKVKDQFGQDHYIMIEPDQEDISFPQGSEVLLVRQDGVKFYAIVNDNPFMSEG